MSYFVRHISRLDCDVAPLRFLCSSSSLRRHYTFWLFLCLTLLNALSALAQGEKLSTFSAEETEVMLLSGSSTLAIPDTAHIGLVRLGICDSTTIPILNTGVEEVAISLASVTFPSAFTIANGSIFPLNLGSGKQESIIVRYCPDNTGCLNGDIILHTRGLVTGEESFNTIAIGGCAGAPSMKITSDQIDFGTVAVGKCGRQLLRIENEGDFPLIIENLEFATSVYNMVETSGGQMSIDPASQLHIPIEFCPPDTGEFLDSIVISSNSPESPTGMVYLQGRGEEGKLELLQEIDFGPLRPGTCRDTTLTITNNSSVPLVIDTIEVAAGPGGNAFALSPIQQPFPLELESGEEIMVDLQFCPAGVGPAEGELRILHSAGKIDATLLRGQGAVGILDAPGENDLGYAFIGNCHDTTLILGNKGEVDLVIRAIRLAPLSGKEYLSLPPSQLPALPFNLPPGETLPLSLRFCPDDSGAEAAAIVLEYEGKENDTLQLAGNGLLPVLEITPGNLNVGRAYIGLCREDSVLLRNPNPVPLKIDAKGSRLTSGQEAFSYKWTEAGESILLAAEEETTIYFSFCPLRGKSQSQGEFLLRYGKKEEAIIHLAAEATRPLIWLDTIQGEAGTKLEQGLFISPDLYSQLEAKEFSIRLQINPAALFPLEVEGNVPGINPTLDHETAGLLRVNGTVSEGIQPEEPMLLITYQGLSSGEPVNNVSLSSITLDGEESIEWERSEGVVLLSGCDIGRNVPFGRSAHIISTQPSPAISRTTVIYQTPEGRTPLMMLYNAQGSCVSSIPLPEGNGGEQSITLDLQGHPRGIYMLELIEREVHHSLPLFISH